MKQLEIKGDGVTKDSGLRLVYKNAANQVLLDIEVMDDGSFGIIQTRDKTYHKVEQFKQEQMKPIPNFTSHMEY